MSSAISVVIPCFNGRKYVLEALESAQIEGKVIGEVLVVDDASTDNSAGYLEGLGLSGVTLLRLTHNRGIGGARNAAIPMVRCPYIAFLDADDLWTRGRSAALLKAAQAANTPWAFGAIEHFLSPDYVGEKSFALPPVQTGYFASSMVVETAFFKTVGNFNESLRLGEFIDWYDRARRLAPPPALLEQVVLKRRIHGANTSITGGGQNAREYLKMAREAIQRKRSQI